MGSYRQFSVFHPERRAINGLQSELLPVLGERKHQRWISSEIGTVPLATGHFFFGIEPGWTVIVIEFSFGKLKQFTILVGTLYRLAANPR